jgi:hypothetical protein
MRGVIIDQDDPVARAFLFAQDSEKLLDRIAVVVGHEDDPQAIRRATPRLRHADHVSSRHFLN